MNTRSISFYRMSFGAAFNNYLLFSLGILIVTFVIEKFLQGYTEYWKSYGLSIGIGLWLGFGVAYWRFWKNTVYDLELFDNHFIVNKTKKFPYTSVIKVEERFPYGFYLWGTNYIFNFMSKDKNEGFLQDSLGIFNSYYRRYFISDEFATKSKVDVYKQIQEATSPPAIAQESLVLLFLIPLFFLCFAVLGPWLIIDPRFFETQLIQRSFLVLSLFLFTLWLYRSLKKGKFIEKGKMIKFIILLQGLVSLGVIVSNSVILKKFNSGIQVVDIVKKPESTRDPASQKSHQIILLEGQLHREVLTEGTKTYQFTINSDQDVSVSCPACTTQFLSN